jgi:tRNA threonylcarbamoyladenosine biosynthesis protein TsaE
MSERTFVWLAANEAETARFGRALADALEGRGVVALNGTLGAGKTRLVQALAAQAGVDPLDVVSPTFVLAHEYQGRHTIHHLDAYRVKDDEEFRQLGAEEYFASGELVLIEWADRVAASLPPERLEIEIEVVGPTTRRFTVRAVGESYQPQLEKLKEALGP